ncbi:hypothetical protein FQR65_LT02405 [Abscondita terminalis]|nr:hypothetical protein FQR65_LT02405 [Abscondita terminalis]
MSGGAPQIGTSPPSYHNFLTSSLSFSERGEPPSYEEAIDPNAPPPSYDSLFGRVREARRTSKGVFEFLKNILIILLGTIGCTIILGVTIVIPICMIVMGSIYLHECPQGEYIPIYLLVGGIFGILKQLLHLSSRVRQSDVEREEEQLRQSPTQTILNCFMLGWFIIGSVWVYKEFEPNYDPNVMSGSYDDDKPNARYYGMLRSNRRRGGEWSGVGRGEVGGEVAHR